MFQYCFKKVRLWLKATQAHGICYIFIKYPGKWCGLLPQRGQRGKICPYESMAFSITPDSDVRKMSLWKRWDYQQTENKIEE